MTKLHKHAAICAGLIAGAMLLARPGMAEDQWQEHHPRRHEVNHRLHHENKRIDEGIKKGQLNPGETQQLRSEQASIHEQEKADAAANGGHITNAEKHQLNSEENNLSHQIHEDRHNGY